MPLSRGGKGAGVCLAMKPVGKPDAGNLHVRFDERGGETERCRMAQATAPFLDSTHEPASRRMDRAPRNVRRRRPLGRHDRAPGPAAATLRYQGWQGSDHCRLQVDRLTRSLADFAKIVDVLDAHHASFVSVTQQFNTTTSMGRLTLNMLLSFAQFEREIAGERIRDKIAASKAKGMWMGGNVPLGYDVRERKVGRSEAEASTVRMIFQRYAELGSVALLKAELERAGIVSKRREGAGGELSGGKRFSRGALYLMLQNWLYRGNVAHKEKIFPGQHQAIIESELWQAVQDRLAGGPRERAVAGGAGGPGLVVGLVFGWRGG